MKSRFDALLRALSALAPGVLAAVGASSVASAAHDDGVVRTAGAGFTGAFRALDLLIAAPAMLLPVGTRSLRAGLASAFVTALCGAVAFEVARELVRVVPAVLRRMGLATPDDASPRLGATVAAVAVLTALLSPAWQVEATAPGGSVTGVLLLLLALRFVMAASREGAGGRARLPAIAFVAGLAASYDVLTFFVVLAAALPWSYASARSGGDRSLSADRGLAIHSLCAFALGLLPLAFGLAVQQRAPEISLDVPALAFIDSGLRAATTLGLRGFVTVDVGLVLFLLGAGGATLSLVAREARLATLSLVLVVFAAAAAVAFHLPAGPNRYAAVVLAGLLALHILATTMLAALVVAISRAPVPFAEASAALVVVFELALPVRAIDETLTRRDARDPRSASIWNDVAWGSAPPASVVLVAARTTMRRIASARAAGAMRGDLVVIPSYDVQGRLGQHALAVEPKLAPLYRDLVLGLQPEELALAQLGGQRAVLATFDPKWDRALSRHLVPIALMSRFEPEPRGASDRRKGLDAFLPSRERLVRATVAKKDPELMAATAALLRPRAIAMAATGERDMLDRSLDDLRAFSPQDPLETILVRRIVTTKGPIDVRDLVP